MSRAEKVEKIINDMTARKGFRQVWDSLDAETRNLIRSKWTEILDEENRTQNVETFLDAKYDHVLKFERDNMKLGQLSHFDDYAIDQRICVNRNLHNGQTTHINIKAKMREGDYLYIAGNEAHKQ